MLSLLKTLDWSRLAKPVEGSGPELALMPGCVLVIAHMLVEYHSHSMEDVKLSE